VDGLRAFFLTALAVLPGENRPRVSVLTGAAGEDGVNEPVVRRSVSGGLDLIGRALARAVRRAGVDCRLTPGAGVDSVTCGLLTSFEGMLVLARLGHSGLDGGVNATLAALFVDRPLLEQTSEGADPGPVRFIAHFTVDEPECHHVQGNEIH
jgi:hypothetical protein